MNDLLTGLLDNVQNVAPVWRVLIAGVAMVLETSVLVGLLVPGDTVVLVAGTAVSSLWEGAGLVATVIAGSLIGESVGFWLGRLLGPRIRHSAIGRLIGETHWQRAERYVSRRGGIAILISRFLPVVHSVVPLTVGMSGYRYRRFLAWTAPACVLWASVYVTVVSVAARTYRDAADTVHIAGYLFIGVIVVFLLLVVGGKKLIERLERRHLAAESPRAADAAGATDALDAGDAADATDPPELLETGDPEHSLGSDGAAMRD